MKAILEKIRMFFFVGITLAVMSLCAIDLMKIQIVDGDEYLRKAQSTSMATQVITSPRGEIVDKNGREIVSNKVGFNIVIEKAFLSSDKQEWNRIIGTIAGVMSEDDVAWIDNLPITKTEPYEFLPDRESDVAKLRKNINVQPYATAEDCMYAMIDLYEIDDAYTMLEKRTIAGIRYEMYMRSFSVSNRYTLAEDIPMDMVVKLKEASYALEGMDIVEEPIRYYNVSDVAPHLIGTTGAINAEEYTELKEKGYALNDTLGKSGVELAMEDSLRGTKGIRTLELLNGTVVSDFASEDAIPGNTVKITLDLDYQRKVQQILDNHIIWLQNQTSASAKGMDANAGALVVLDVKTGALLAAATSPTYDLNDYIVNPSYFFNADNQPLVNRATSGGYRPGSTFKTVTATAALNEGYITSSTTVRCNQTYTYWSDYRPKCTGWHGNISVVTAIEKSCNIFFYDVGRIMGIDRIAEYASYYGLGEITGLETGEYKGYIATPESFANRKLEWQAGLVVQAAIGQSETCVTPLQMAVQAMTIANKGVRYQPYIVDSIYSYNMDELVSKTEPTIKNVIEDKTGSTFDLVIEGMKAAAKFGAYSYPSEKQYYTSYLLSSLPDKAAIKTGTPQMTSASDTGSAFVGFYPADDPVIAFSGFVEHGEYSKLMIKSVIEAYYDSNYDVPVLKSTKIPQVTTEELAGLS